MRLIGLDPGLRHTGWGIVEVSGNRLTGIAAGTIHPRQDGAIADRLAELYAALDEVLDRHAPAEAAVEEGFVNKNAGATRKLGYARGVVLLAPARRGLPVVEYGTATVKKSVVGTGHAEKAQVETMVRRLLPGIEATADAADALAVAICHAHHRQTKALWNAAPSPLTLPLTRVPRAGLEKPSPPGGEGRERVAPERQALAVADAAKRLPHPEETSHARRLRQDSTRSELVLWEQLRAKRFGGHKFRRQEPILGYTADFVCHERRLIIEVDGGQHADSTHDARRDATLHQAGFRTLRFWNNDVSENLDGVLQTIKSALDAAALSPTLSPGGRGSEGGE